MIDRRHRHPHDLLDRRGAECRGEGMADLLLVGGTGLLGGKIAERLAARDVPFLALVRPQTDASPLEALGAEIVRGDLRDPGSVTAAVAGMTTVVTTANAIGRLLTGVKDLSIEDV